MIAITLTGLNQRIRAIEAMERDLPRTQEQIVGRASIVVRSKVVGRMSDPGGRDAFFGRTGGQGNALAARSGQSRARITPGGQVVTIGDRAVAEIRSPDRHVAFLEEGGTIQGKPYLRIPLASAQTAQGVDRYAGKSIRDIPGAFLQRTRRGNLFAMRREGGTRSARVTLLYLLVRSVTLRGRHVFRDARNEAEPEIAQMASVSIQAMIRRANAA